MEKNNNIKQLLSQQYFLSSASADALLKRIEGYPDEALVALEAILKEALEKQTEVIKKIAEKDPVFLSSLRKFAHEKFKTLLAQFKQEDAKNTDIALEKIFNDI